jgi:hypothetical protein
MPQAFVVIGGLLSQLGVPGFLTGAVSWLGTSTIGTAIVTLGVSFGLNYLASLLLKPKAPSPEDVQTNIRNPVAARMRFYGRNKAGGVIAFIESKQGWLYKVIALAHDTYRAADAIEELWADSNNVTVDGNGDVAQYPFEYQLQLHSRVGVVPETSYAPLTAGFPEWTSAHRGDGVASLLALQKPVAAENFSKRFPNGVNTLYRAVMRGVRLYDPTDGGQDIGDPATWTWSDNLAREMLDYFHHPDGLRLPTSLFTTAQAVTLWQQAVADCNDVIALKGGGTEPRYRGWGGYSLEERPAEVLGRIMAAGEVRIVPTNDGGFGIDVGKWTAPTVTLDENAIIGIESWGRGRDILTGANVIRSKYLSADHDYQSTEAQPWENAADVALRGEVAAPVDFIMAPSHGQCRRLMKIASYDAAPDWAGTIAFNLKGLRAIGHRFIRLVYAPFGIDGVFKIRDAQLLIGETSTLVGVKLDLTAAAEEAYNWNATTEEGTPSAADDVTVDREIPVPTGFDVTIEQVSINGQTVAVAKVEWDAPPNESLRVEAQFKLSTDGQWSPINVSNDATFARTGILIDGQTYNFRLRHVSVTGRASDWTSTIDRVAVASTTAPPDVTAVTLSTSPETVTLGFTTPNSVHFFKARIYRSQTNNPATASFVQDVFCAPNTVQTVVLSGAPLGTWYYWVAASNGSNVEATRVAPAPAFVLVTGPELVVNGGFDTGSSWTTGSGWSIGSGVATRVPDAANTDLLQNVTLAASVTYRVVFTVTARTAGTVTPRFGGGTAVLGTARNAAGTYTEDLVAAAGGNTTFFLRATSTANLSVDNISIKRIA